MPSTGGWIVIDVLLAIAFTAMLWKRIPRIKTWYTSTSEKEKSKQILMGWLLPFGIAFALYGCLWLGFHDTAAYSNVQNFIYPQPTIDGVPIVPFIGNETLGK